MQSVLDKIKNIWRKPRKCSDHDWALYLQALLTMKSLKQPLHFLMKCIFPTSG